MEKYRLKKRIFPKEKCYRCHKEFDFGDLKDELKGQRPIFFDFKGVDPAGSTCGHIYHMYICETCEQEKLKEEELEQLNEAKIEKIASSLQWTAAESENEEPYEYFIIKKDDKRLSKIGLLVVKIMLSNSIGFFKDNSVTRLRIGDQHYWLWENKILRR